MKKEYLVLWTDKTFGVKYNQVVNGKCINENTYLICFKRQRLIVLPNGEITCVLNKEKTIANVVKKDNNIIYLDIKGE